MHVTDCNICCTNRLVKWSLSWNTDGIDEQEGLKACLHWKLHSPDARVLDPCPQQKGLCASLLKQRSVLADLTVTGWNFKYDLKENSTKTIGEWVGEGNVPTSLFFFLLFLFSSNSISPTLAKPSLSRDQAFKLWVSCSQYWNNALKKKAGACRAEALMTWLWESLLMETLMLWKWREQACKLGFPSLGYSNRKNYNT